jgi:hypothetical protein
MVQASHLDILQTKAAYESKQWSHPLNLLLARTPNEKKAKTLACLPKQKRPELD